MRGEPLLKGRGDYRNLLTFQKATVVHDPTCFFCEKHLRKGDRAVDQRAQTVRSDEVIANRAICLIHQTTYLLRKKLAHLGESFLQEGGLRERMTRMRLEAHREQGIHIP